MDVRKHVPEILPGRCEIAAMLLGFARQGKLRLARRLLFTRLYAIAIAV
jgi:hypothetical protein